MWVIGEDRVLAGDKNRKEAVGRGSRVLDEDRVSEGG